ncbi:MAG: hypothetical protein AAF456_01105 [Planctomycetota bacterium]
MNEKPAKPQPPVKPHRPGFARTNGVALVGIALAVWCAIMVYGIIRSPETGSWIKPLIMFSVFALFGLLWMGLLWMRSRSNRD